MEKLTNKILDKKYFEKDELIKYIPQNLYTALDGDKHEYMEGGIQDIKKLAKRFQKAVIFFHKDLDGVTSAIAMKEYLEKYDIDVTDAEPINYGSEEFKIKKTGNDTLNVLVDFAHGKPMMHIHTDHHDKQTGVTKGQATKFVHARSNLEDISTKISPQEVFPPADVKLINTVDSADFAGQEITPDDVFKSIFNIKKNESVEKNRTAFGLVVNKLTLSYKNKPKFLKELVLRSGASLISMYRTIKGLIKELSLRPTSDIEKGMEEYISAQKKKIVEIKTPSDVKNLKTGQSGMVKGNIVVQYGGGTMFKGYDRYTVFKNHPDAEYMVLGWPMGLIQVTMNPFKKNKPDMHMGKIVWKAMDRLKPEFEDKEVSLGYMKRIFEKDIKPEVSKEAVGFTKADILAMFTPEQLASIEGDLDKDDIKALLDKPSSELSSDEWSKLGQIKVSWWDVMKQNSGGHKAITNLSGINFLGKGYVKPLKDMMAEIVRELVAQKESGESK